MTQLLRKYSVENFNHLEKFEEFCHYETLYGGPDPHMSAALYMSYDAPDEEKLWRIHCYVGLYNVPSAEAVWRVWSGERYLRESFGNRFVILKFFSSAPPNKDHNHFLTQGFGRKFFVTCAFFHFYSSKKYSAI